MIMNDKVDHRLKGKVKITVIDTISNKILGKTIINNAVVEDAKFALVKGIGGVAPTSDYIPSIVKLGDDFTDTWTNGTGTITTDLSDITKRTITGTGTNFQTQISSLDPGGVHLSNGRVWIKSGGEYKRVIAIDAVLQKLTLDSKFTTDLTSDPFQFVVGYGIDFPKTALTSYDETTMELIFNSDLVFGGYTFVVNHSLSQPTAEFSFTIIGQDVMDQNPGVTSKNFCSAALHTGNGNVFSYLRFPKIGISSLVNINFVWTIYYD